MCKLQNWFSGSILFCVRNKIEVMENCAIFWNIITTKERTIHTLVKKFALCTEKVHRILLSVNVLFCFVLIIMTWQMTHSLDLPLWKKLMKFFIKWSILNLSEVPILIWRYTSITKLFWPTYTKLVTKESFVYGFFMSWEWKIW